MLRVVRDGLRAILKDTCPPFNCTMKGKRLFNAYVDTIKTCAVKPPEIVMGIQAPPLDACLFQTDG
jgi:hypothetical protein